LEVVYRHTRALDELFENKDYWKIAVQVWIEFVAFAYFTFPILHLLLIQIGHNTRQGVLNSVIDGTDNWQTYATALSRGCCHLLESFSPRTRRQEGQVAGVCECSDEAS
jgi:hypothetical protein